MSDSIARPVLIVGLQKSGTTLLTRLCQQLPGWRNPLPGEGREFWGDDPPFNPQAEPTGLLYQSHRGARGHVLQAADFQVAHQQLLTDRLRACSADAEVLVLKNPFNTLRLPWLAEMFPQALRIAMIREPVANVFSLSKKFHDHPDRGLGPDQGWWGVKPAGWQQQVEAPLLQRLAWQWNAVNAHLLDTLGEQDLLIRYADLCANPRAVLQEIARRLGRAPDAQHLELPPLSCFDDEPRQGGALRSRNRDLIQSRRFEPLPTTGPGLDALSTDQVQDIARHCAAVWQAAALRAMPVSGNDADCGAGH